MKRLNIKFLILLLVPSILIAVGVVYRHDSQVAQTEKYWLRQSTAAEEQGDDRLALDELLKFLKKNPDDTERETKAAFLAADIVLEDGSTPKDFNLAKRLLETAARESKKGSEARHALERKLIDVLVHTGRLNEAYRLIEEHLKLTPDDPELVFHAAMCSIGLKLTATDERADAYLKKLLGFVVPTREVREQEGKQAEFDESIALDVRNIEAYSLLAQYYWHIAGDPQMAGRVIDGMIGMNGVLKDKKTASEAWLLRGLYRQEYEMREAPPSIREDLRKEARKEVAKAVALDAELPAEERSDKPRLVLAEILSNDGELEEAKSELLRVIAEHPNSINAYLALAHLTLRTNNAKDALQVIVQGLEASPGNVDLLWRKMHYHLIDRDPEGMQQVIRSMRESEVDEGTILVSEALVPIAKEEWSAAIRSLQEARPKVANRTELEQTIDRNLATCYGETRQWDRMLELYQALQSDPDFEITDEILLGHSRALLNLRRPRDAVIYLRSQIDRRGGPARVSPRVRDVLASAEATLARARMEADTAPLAPVEGQVEDEEIVGGPEDWIKERGFWQVVGRKTSLILGGEGDEDARHEEAKALVKKSLELYDEHIDTLPESEQKLALRVWRHNYYNYVGSILNREGRAPALAELEELRTRRGDTGKNIIESSRIMVRDPDRSRREKLDFLKQLEQRVENLEEEERAMVWLHLGSSYAYAGGAGTSEADRCWKLARALTPDDTSTLRQLFDLAMQKGDEQAMLASLQSIESTLGRDDPVWKYARSQYLLTTASEADTDEANEQRAARLKEARRLVDEALEIRPSWHMLHHLRGHVREMQGDLAGATSDYAMARSLGSRDASLASHLMDLYIRQGDFRQANVLFRSVRSDFPDRERIGAILAASLADDAYQAIDTIDKYTPAESASWLAFVEKGEMYDQAATRFDNPTVTRRLHEKAEANYRLAAAMEPALADPWLQLFEFFLTSKKDPRGAERVLREAEANLPDDIARSVLAEGYLRLEDIAQAEHYLTSILNTQPTNLAAMRGLAIHYLRLNQTRNGKELLESIVHYPGEQNSYALEMMMWARRQLATVLVNSGDLADFHEAIEHVSWNRSKKPDSAQDYILHAQILSTRSEPRFKREALDLLVELAEKSPHKLTVDAVLLMAGLQYRDATISADERWNRCMAAMEMMLDKERSERSRSQEASRLAQHGMMLLDRRDFDQAKNYMRHLERLEPNEPRSIRLIATWHMAYDDEGRDDAISAISRLLPGGEITDETFDQVVMAARLFDEQGLDNHANETFRRLAAEHPRGRIELAKYLARSRSSDEALSIAESYAKAGNVEAAVRIGNLVIQNPGVDASRTEVRAMRKRVGQWYRAAGNSAVSKSVAFRFLEGDFAIQTDDAPRAAEIFRQLLREDDLTKIEEAQAANNLAFVLAATEENLDEALDLVNRAVELIGPQIGILDTKGVVHLARGECSEAVASLEEAVSMDANRPRFRGNLRSQEEAPAQTYFHLALAYKCAGDRQKADAAYETAHERRFSSGKIKPLKPSLIEELEKWLRP
ncbi:MAG: hypothetical protein DWQ35_01950 [Planctomycetota bacterium]|nr:MAG: hypothetical protein DWQ35_01950 [Planctomycetota bacterium]REK27747.1 MAG: hypothetical protein DWQ42_07220 [Planctomycetota bacterium]REK48112.1 MAG: hypothetical protein DWQ46_02800 [Planctomycetota bacterium]